MEAKSEGLDLPGTQDKDSRVTVKGKTQPDRRRAVLSVLAAVLLWSTSYAVTKVGVGDIPPLTFGAIRFLFASAVVSLLALFTRRIEQVPARDVLRLAVGGLFGITIYFSLQNLGVQRTSASNATLLVASFPAITMLLEVAFLKRSFSLARFAGVGIAFVGVYLVIRQTIVSGQPRHLEGDMLLLGTGVAWALYNFTTQDVIRKYSTLTVIFWQTLTGTIAFLPLTLLEPRAWQSLNPTGLIGALFLGIFCSIIAFMLYGYGLKSLDPGSAVSLMNLVPVFGLILAVVGLKEQVNFIQVLGGLIVVAGVTLSVRSHPRETS